MSTTIKTSRIKARIEDTPIEKWKEWFSAKTGLIFMSAMTQVSATTIGAFRRKLGYKHWPRGGYSQQVYTREDAKRIAKAMKSSKSISDAGMKCGYSPKQAQHIARKFRDIIPATRVR